MREIKFRFWNREENQMISGDTLAFEEYAPLYQLLSQEGIMQYTGIKDKNDREIYEGDIVHLSSDDGVDYKALIVFKDGGFCAIDGSENDYSVRRYGLSRYDLKVEVIGNIFENPELLEANDE